MSCMVKGCEEASEMVTEIGRANIPLCKKHWTASQGMFRAYGTELKSLGECWLDAIIYQDHVQNARKD